MFFKTYATSTPFWDCRPAWKSTLISKWWAFVRAGSWSQRAPGHRTASTTTPIQSANPIQCVNSNFAKQIKKCIFWQICIRELKRIGALVDQGTLYLLRGLMGPRDKLTLKGGQGLYWSVHTVHSEGPKGPSGLIALYTLRGPGALLVSSHCIFWGFQEPQWLAHSVYAEGLWSSSDQFTLYRRKGPVALEPYQSAHAVYSERPRSPSGQLKVYMQKCPGPQES